jgi:hypothetical protein
MSRSPTTDAQKSADAKEVSCDGVAYEVAVDGHDEWETRTLEQMYLARRAHDGAGCCWVWVVLDLSGPARGFPSNLARATTREKIKSHPGHSLQKHHKSRFVWNDTNKTTCSLRGLGLGGLGDSLGVRGSRQRERSSSGMWWMQNQTLGGNNNHDTGRKKKISQVLYVTVLSVQYQTNLTINAPAKLGTSDGR